MAPPNGRDEPSLYSTRQGRDSPSAYVLLAKRLQPRQVRHRLDLQVPAQLPHADRAQVHRPAVLLPLVVAAVHQAQVGGAVGHAQDVAGFVGGRAEGPAQAEGEVLPRIAVTVDGPDAECNRLGAVRRPRPIGN